MLDTKIRNGVVLDGSGGAPRQVEIGVADGRIVALGHSLGPARRNIDADGALVTPGFVDIHTHYDGQVEWDPYLSPSSSHGVTSVVMSNCGVGFAPVRPGDRDRLIALMEGVEDIPNPVMAEGLSWAWETLPEYMDAIAAKPHAIDFAVQIPHGPLRVYVMGERGASRAPAEPADLAAMQAIVIEALDAGALGFSTSRTFLHKTSAGDPTPSYDAAERELLAIGAAMRKAGRGVIEIVSDFRDGMEEFQRFVRLAQESGRPMTVSVAQTPERPESHRALLGLLQAAQAPGVSFKGQVIGRPIGVLFGLEASAHPFFANPAFQPLENAPLAEQVARMRDPSVRAAILARAEESDAATLARYPAYIGEACRQPGTMYRLGAPPNYLPDPATRADAVAARAGISPFEVVYDWLLEAEGQGLLYVPINNWAWGTDEAIREMLHHPQAVLGLSDGGAHYGMICDSSAPTFMLTHWARDARPEARIPVETVVHWLTERPARAVGLGDRGRLALGRRADVNIIRHDRLRLHAPRVTRDLPAGGRRFTQSAEGYMATMVAGEIILEDGEMTGAMPGRLVRGARPEPV